MVVVAVVVLAVAGVLVPMGQRTSLQASESERSGQGSPPSSGCTSTVRDRWRTPPLQEALHSPQAPHSDTAQLAGPSK